MIDVLDLIAKNRAGATIGLPCFCTANEHVLLAILDDAARTGFPTVIEATCNQVNQDGGYTGMTPQDFMDWLRGMAKNAGVSMDQLIVGGDHLGPNPWRAEPAAIAMEKAHEMVKQYVKAGFQKIHLDASMACGDETHLTFTQIARRAADLCVTAEKYAPNPKKIIYIIGTEVPIPGGETEEPTALDVTSVARFQDTISTHREAFASRGLDAAWHRIVSVVTQPGVDFGHSSIYPYVPAKAQPLKEAILVEDGLTFEAHSTDYQPTPALGALVSTHFFFLKVGPELTFRFREAVWALSDIETQMQLANPSRIKDVMAAAMRNNPDHWVPYYRGTSDEIETQKVFGYSDRIRYYWTEPTVADALKTLLSNLDAQSLSDPIISQSFMGLEFGEIISEPRSLLSRHIQRCVRRYFEAAGFSRYP
jgi:D-tagatose-1,6-bisphosphate aldolase subunit GatZ/KbaZ